MLRCESCNSQIEELHGEDALNDIEGHGFPLDGARHIKCFDCANQYDEYETYYAGRIKRGHPGKVFQKMPDISGKNPDKLVECYTLRTKAAK